MRQAKEALDYTNGSMTQRAELGVWPGLLECSVRLLCTSSQPARRRRGKHMLPICCAMSPWAWGTVINFPSPNFTTFSAMYIVPRVQETGSRRFGGGSRRLARFAHWGMCGGDHLKVELAEFQHAPGIPFELAMIHRDRCGTEARASSAGHGSWVGTVHQNLVCWMGGAKWSLSPL